MPDQAIDTDFRQSLVAAVQAELQRHAATIGAEIDRLREEGAEERANLRRELQSQIGSLARVVEEAQAQAESNQERFKAAFEARVLESESRQTRRLEDVTAGLATTVQAVAKPILADVAADHDRVTARLDGLEQQLRKFDEQAARMVTYVNDVIRRVETRQVEVADALEESVAAQVMGLRPLVDEIDSRVRRFQSDIGSQVSTRLGEAEDRFNTRLMAAESRMKEAAGTQIAEIQAHVGRVSAHMDETLAVLNNRAEQIADRFVDVDRRFESVEQSIKGVDQTALDDVREKMSAAVGEAMLVRIEMERLQKGIDERTDSLAVRVTEAEAKLADATMDVASAVQLDRLEELERAVLELDPTRFAAYDPASVGPTPVPPPAGLAAPKPGASRDPQHSLNNSSGLAEEVAEPARAPFAPPAA